MPWVYWCTTFFAFYNIRIFIICKKIYKFVDSLFVYFLTGRYKAVKINSKTKIIRNGSYFRNTSVRCNELYAFLNAKLTNYFKLKYELKSINFIFFGRLN